MNGSENIKKIPDRFLNTGLSLTLFSSNVPFRFVPFRSVCALPLSNPQRLRDEGKKTPFITSPENIFKWWIKRVRFPSLYPRHCHHSFLLSDPVPSHPFLHLQPVAAAIPCWSFLSVCSASRSLCIKWKMAYSALHLCCLFFSVRLQIIAIRAIFNYQAMPDKHQSERRRKHIAA